MITMLLSFDLIFYLQLFACFCIILWVDRFNKLTQRKK